MAINKKGLWGIAQLVGNMEDDIKLHFKVRRKWVDEIKVLGHKMAIINPILNWHLMLSII